jgi:hypothetical protein
MAYSGVIFAGTLFNINVAASGAIAALNPLLAQIDFTLFGSVGIGAIQADLQAQLQAALDAQASFSLSISSPVLDYQTALAGIAALIAQIQLGLSLALSGQLVPLISIDASLSFSASVSFAALLSLQIGSLEAIIQAGLAAKLPAVSFAAQLSAALGAGPLFVLAFDNIPMSSAASSLGTDLATGLTFGPNNIAPSDQVYGILIITKDISAWAALQATMLTV